MAKQRVLVLGAGKAARYVAYIFGYRDDVEIFGFSDPDKATWGTTLAGRPVLGADEEAIERALREGVRYATIGIGAVPLRHRLRGVLESAGFELVSAVHPSAFLSPAVELGKGVVIEAGSVLSDNPRLEDNVWIGLAAMVSHDTVIGRDCSVGGRAAVGAEVTIGERTQIGMGSIIQSQRRIGSDTIIGSGSNVISDIPDGVVAVGNPATIIKTRDLG